MSTFVLVHGAWQTSSTWDLVTPILEAAGHAVVIPRLRGLENDSNVLSSAIGLHTHVDDVLEALNRHNLHCVTLVGHSYAGMIITAVAEHALDRLSRLGIRGRLHPQRRTLRPGPIARQNCADVRQQAEAAGEGWRLRGGEGQLDLWGLKPGPHRDFVRSRLSDFSLRCFEEQVSLPANAAATLPRTFIACLAETYPARPIFQRFGDQAKQEGWKYHELLTGHDCHVEMPDAFTSKLLN
jgi:pimeloyl-ACP methyl ester carboxylesterase